MDRQCPSCGGFCKKSGCERENAKPKEWVGLTREDKDDLVHALPDIYSMEHVILATEAKLKEKNT